MTIYNLDRLERWQAQNEIIFAQWLAELRPSNDDDIELPDDIDFINIDDVDIADIDDEIIVDLANNDFNLPPNLSIRKFS